MMLKLSMMALVAESVRSESRCTKCWYKQSYCDNNEVCSKMHNLKKWIVRCINNRRAEFKIPKLKGNSRKEMSSEIPKGQYQLEFKYKKTDFSAEKPWYTEDRVKKMVDGWRGTEPRLRCHNMYKAALHYRKCNLVWRWNQSIVSGLPGRNRYLTLRFSGSSYQLCSHCNLETNYCKQAFKGDTLPVGFSAHGCFKIKMFVSEIIEYINERRNKHAISDIRVLLNPLDARGYQSVTFDYESKDTVDAHIRRWFNSQNKASLYETYEKVYCRWYKEDGKLKFEFSFGGDIYKKACEYSHWENHCDTYGVCNKMYNIEKWSLEYLNKLRMARGRPRLQVAKMFSNHCAQLYTKYEKDYFIDEPTEPGVQTEIDNGRFGSEIFHALGYEKCSASWCYSSEQDIWYLVMNFDGSHESLS